MSSELILDPSRPELQNLESRVVRWEQVDEIPDEFLIPDGDDTLLCAWDRRFFKGGRIVFFLDRNHHIHRVGEPAIFHGDGGVSYFRDGYHIKDPSKPDAKSGSLQVALNNESPYTDDDELDLHDLILIPRDVAELITLESMKQLPSGTSAAQAIGLPAFMSVERFNYGDSND